MPALSAATHAMLTSFVSRLFTVIASHGFIGSPRVSVDAGPPRPDNQIVPEQRQLSIAVYRNHPPPLILRGRGDSMYSGSAFRVEVDWLAMGGVRCPWG